MLNKKPENRIIKVTDRKIGSGLKYKPEIIPAQNGRPIRRKGISL